MKKIALITWKFHNYGTVLQAFATSYFLNQVLNVKCDLVNYDLNKINLDIPQRFSPLKIINKIKKRTWLEFDKLRFNHIVIPWSEEIQKRENKFETFIKNIPQTEKMGKSSLNKLNDDYEIFICGSDQIWNPKFFDGSYMLDFVNSDKKKIAFSPSFGTTHIPPELENLYKERLLNLDSISVREDTGCEIVYKLTKRKAMHLCDPTLLLSRNDWINAFQLKVQSQEYILCYFLSNNIWYKDMLLKIKECLNLPIKIIGVKELSYKIENTQIIHPGPIEFVQYIANAKFVVTDSFHGMLFSTNFNIPYIVLQRFSEKSNESENSRLKSFMKLAKLEKRYYTYATELNSECFDLLSESQICYIESLREASIKYLKDNIITEQ